MKASTRLQTLYSPLDLRSGTEVPRPALVWQKWLGQRLQALVTAMRGSTGPQIRQMQDDQLSWRAYDPVSKQAAHFTSENELRQWLEQRYYH